ncbi:hypothetical protein AWB81_06670 [Caballeronia arationis]|nr:hypothetical protein AWB81_06670 [Caballeronia arationis]
MRPASSVHPLVALCYRVCRPLSLRTVIVASLATLALNASGAPSEPAGLVARGAYLARAADCAGCHRH